MPTGDGVGRGKSGPRLRAPDRVLTPRLQLVRPTPADAEPIFSLYASDPEVTRFLSWPRHQSIDDTHRFLAFSEDEWSRWPAGPYLIRSRDDGRLMGGTGFSFESAETASTGYVLARSEWGRGYATEALRAIVDLAPGLGVVRLYAFCHHAHHASAHVLEKCGFVRQDSTRRMEFPNHTPGTLQPALCFERFVTAGAV
ncbi:MAG TPA: GNAT family N-acetyltransferase [Vicinamibacterales bacterium]|nr:GNAT family N-acetyltransferase [Vicinamibacterales bacterium]